MMQIPTMSRMPVQALAPPNQQAQPVYEVTDEDKKRQKAIAAAWKAYNGELDKPLQKMPGQPDDNVMTNRCQAIVDQGVNFLFDQEIEISIEEKAPDAAQVVLDKIWGRKEARIPLLQKIAMNGAIAGTAFLRIVPNSKSTAFRLVAVDPSIVFVQTAPQDVETVLLYCIEYSCTEKQHGKDAQVYYHEEISRVDPSPQDDVEGYEDLNADGWDTDITWSVQHWTRIGDRGPWTPAGDPIAWEYPFAPLFSCQNLPKPNDFWGMPDITPDLIGVNNALNLVQSNINRILKLYGNPILYATGTGEQVIDIAPGKVIGLPLSESKIVAVTLTSDIANALAFVENLRSDIDEQSAVPGVATGRIKDMPRGNLSGIAIELLFMSLLKKTFKKRCTYGEMMIDVSKALLVLNKLSYDIDVTLAWQSPIPHDDLPSVQAALAKKQISISDATLMRELGYDPDEEMMLNETEDARKLAAYARGQTGSPITPLQEAVPGVPRLPGQEYPQQMKGSNNL